MREMSNSKNWEIHIPFEVHVIQNHEDCPDFFFFAALKGEEGEYTGWMNQTGYKGELFCPYCGQPVEKGAK